MEIIQGVEGLRPRAPIGVVATVGHRGQGGTPVDKDRFFLMAPDAPAKAYGSKSYFTRELHGQFKAWNDAANAGDPRTRTLSGVIVHSDFHRAVDLSRVAMKLPDMANPSKQPCCRGNGREASRFSGVLDGVEVFAKIACPGRLCPYAQGDSPPCKPTAHLLFMLQWIGGQAKMPSMLCAWSSRSPRSIENMLGLFALVLGTQAVAPDSDPDTWEPGLAASLGITNPSLVGLPFTMTVGERTNAEKRTRYPTVRFSAGDLEAWIRSQAQLRELVGGPALAALPAAPIDTMAPEFEAALPGLRMDVAAPGEVIEDAEEIAADQEPLPEFLSSEQVYELERLCGDLGVSVVDLCASLGVSKGLASIKVSAQDTPAALAKRIEATIRAKAGQKTAQPQASSKRK